MNTLLILAIQTTGLAILVILLLLLGASIIAYLTAWLYYKSIYTKKIEVLQSEKDQLNEQIDTLKSENDNLQKSLLEKDDEIDKLKKKQKS